MVSLDGQRCQGTHACARHAALLPVTPDPAQTCSAACQVHAHGGQLIRHEGRYWWLGTSQKQPPWWISWAINL